MGRTTQRFAGTSFDVGQIGAFGWLAICLILLAWHSLIVFSPWNHYILVQEDGWVENLTAVAYLLAGALLLAAAWAETRRASRFVFLAGGVAMTFIAGEEISWGQRIWDFPTPDFLVRNMQGEFNIHNVPNPAVIVPDTHLRPVHDAALPDDYRRAFQTQSELVRHFAAIAAAAAGPACDSIREDSRGEFPG